MSQNDSRGITAPQGFRAAGLHCGIKKAGLLDLALVVLTSGPIAGVFTTNQVVAAPVALDRLHLRHGVGRAILINSGNANACTGRPGMAAAQHCGGRRTNIGHSIPKSSSARQESSDARFPWTASSRRSPLIRAPQQPWRTECGPCHSHDRSQAESHCPASAHQRPNGHHRRHGEGLGDDPSRHGDDAGLPHNRCGDYPYRPAKALTQAVDESFNCISVDGDTSTNDTVLCLANGLAGNRLIREGTRLPPVCASVN